MTTLTPEYHEQPSAAPAPPIIEQFLRDAGQVWRQIYQQHSLNTLLRHMLLTSGVALACYGLVIGISHSIWQALASAVKLPLLFLLTLAICLPVLYLFNLLMYGRAAVRQVLALALAAITVTAGLTLAFAPITLFFLLTVQSYSFFVLLNVAILALTGIIGLQYMVRGAHTLNKLDAAQQQAVATELTKSGSKPFVHTGLLALWLGLYAFVGTQLAWTLSPFFGQRESAFILFRPVEGNFYLEVLRLLFDMLIGR